MSDDKYAKLRELQGSWPDAETLLNAVEFVSESGALHMASCPDLARIAELERERDHNAVTLGQAQSDIVGLRGRLATAERERDELRKRVEALEGAFGHAHRADIKGGQLVDECKLCGLSYRDEIHGRPPTPPAAPGAEP